MKRIAVLALIVGTLFIAPMGAASAAECEFSVPQMPDECLTEPVYDYVTGLQADDLDAHIRVGNLEIEADGMRRQIWQQSVDITAARQATSLALGERDAALDQIERLNVTVTGLQAKVRILKKRVKKLEAQLPHYVG